MEKRARIYVAGHRGMVGSAIVRELERQGYENIIGKTRQELDLTSQEQVRNFFSTEEPEYVFLAAATVGGILANMLGQARFLLQNIQIECNIIECAYEHRVKKLLFLGSSCIYPKDATQPIVESELLTGPLEPTNEGYAIAKIAGLKLCEYLNRQNQARFVSVMPCNLYGTHDNFDLQNSHMLPGLLRRFYEAKEGRLDSVTVWGTGQVFRELLFVDDLAEACVFVMQNYSAPEFLNVGYGKDYTISDIAGMVKDVVGYTGAIKYDNTKPDGMYRKIMDSSKINELGWKPRTELKEGIAKTYSWYLENLDKNVRR